MKRLLFISGAPPLPTNNGQRLRIWSLLRAFAQEGYEIHFLTFVPPEEMESYAGDLAEVCCTADAVPLTLASWSSGGHYGSRLSGLFSPVPYGVERFRSPEMARRIAMRLREPFSAVIAASVYVAVNLPDWMEPPLIMDDDNIEHMILKRCLDGERNPARWAYIWLEWRKLRRWERSVCSRAALVMLCSENDRSLMREMCREPLVAMVPNVIDVDSYDPAPQSAHTTVLYLGSMDWFPNRDAVEFFVGAILPELRKRVPHVRFVVTFSPEHAPPAGFRERFARTPNVEFVPTHDVRRTIAEAAVFVVSLRIGSGTRFKILEAGAMGKPIVSTRVGAEGLDFTSGEEILLEDDPASFATAVATLLGDEAMRTRLGRAARRRVEKQYDFAAMRSALSDAIAQLDALGSVSTRSDAELRVKSVACSSQGGSS
jgi:glycosyltransferase involved in cell wall biosynthesis